MSRSTADMHIWLCFFFKIRAVWRCCTTGTMGRSEPDRRLSLGVKTVNKHKNQSTDGLTGRCISFLQWLSVPFPFTGLLSLMCSSDSSPYRCPDTLYFSYPLFMPPPHSPLICLSVSLPFPYWMGELRSNVSSIWLAPSKTLGSIDLLAYTPSTNVEKTLICEQTC